MIGTEIELDNGTEILNARRLTNNIIIIFFIILMLYLQK